MLRFDFCGWSGAEILFSFGFDSIDWMVIGRVLPSFEMLGTAKLFSNAESTVSQSKRKLIQATKLGSSYCGAISSLEEEIRCPGNCGCRLCLLEWNRRIHMLVKEGHLEKAHLVYKQMLQKNTCPDSCTFNILMHGFGKAGKFEEVNQLYHKMREQACNLTVVALGTIIDVLCKAGKLDDALLFHTEHKVLANLIVYNTLLHGLARAGRIAEAFDLVSEMIDLGLHLDTFTYNILIEGLGKAGNIQAAWDLFEGMGQVCSPDVLTYNLMMKFLVKDGQLDEASKLMTTMTNANCKPDIVTYGTLIDGLGKSGQVNEARKVFGHMQALGIKPNLISYSTLINALCKKDRLEEAMQLYRNMQAARCSPDIVVYTTLFTGLCKVGRIRQALRLLKEMTAETTELDLIAYNSIINILGKWRKMDHAFSLYNLMLASGCNPDVVTYNTLIAGLAKSGNDTGALDLFYDMQAAGCKPDVVTCTTLVDLLCKSNRIQESFELLEEMRIQGIVPNSVTYQCILHGLCKAGQVQMVQRLHHKGMVGKGCAPDVVTYQRLIQGFAEPAQALLKKAFDIYQAMTQRGYACDQDTLYMLIESLREARMWKETRYVWSSVVKNKK